jgi:hypothetical protein
MRVCLHLLMAWVGKIRRVYKYAKHQILYTLLHRKPEIVARGEMQLQVGSVVAACMAYGQGKEKGLVRGEAGRVNNAASSATRSVLNGPIAHGPLFRAEALH